MQRQEELPERFSLSSGPDDLSSARCFPPQEDKLVFESSLISNNMSCTLIAVWE